MGDAAAKITFYTDLSNVLMLAGILLTVLAIWMFFHFGAIRMIDRVTGIGAKRERARFLKEQEKRSEQVYHDDTYDDSDELEEVSISDDVGQKMDTGAYADADSSPVHDVQQVVEHEYIPGDDEPDMSVWDNTSALREMFENTGKDKKKTNKPVTMTQKQTKSQTHTQSRGQKQADQNVQKNASETHYAETGLLAEKTVFEPETGRLKREEREAGCANTFRIVNCIRESVELSEVQV